MVIVDPSYVEIEDTTNPEPVARAVAFLLSEWSVGITGEIVHVDGGYHAMGAALRREDGE